MKLKNYKITMESGFVRTGRFKDEAEALHAHRHFKNPVASLAEIGEQETLNLNPPCPDCGMEYSFFYGIQFHKSGCSRA
tara:strand:+ start:52 stop:288 length:237 start_codon:yes stop_codon:yes gene_type:complete